MKIPLNNQEKKILSFIQKNSLIEKQDSCLIAVSGGADSISLLYLIKKLERLLKIKNIGIAHLNYNLRGNDSINEEIFVEKIAKNLELDFYVNSINLKELLNENLSSMENTARKIRYDFFEEVCSKFNYNKVLTAHNSNDNAETIIMKLIKGSINGLKGIDLIRNFSYKNSNIKIIRPLLCLSRNEIEEYCKKLNIEYKTDYSNFSNDYTRNRVRNNILPLMINENPNFLESIFRSSKIFNQENNYLLKQCKIIFEQSLLDRIANEEKDLIILSHKKINDYNIQEILGKLVKYTFYELLNENKLIPSNRIDEILNNLEKNISGKLIEVGENLFFCKDKDQLLFYKIKK
ncbi:MAG: tRNA lysidine(34) synthetase TilS [Candidatus Sericytochromatia bacterium]